jgi:peptidoglycan hydrolase-like protein with peptidoglycan-binding domain
MSNHIIITGNDTPPVEISHTALFQPVPKPPEAAAAPVVTAALEGTASDAAPKPPSTAPLRMLIARRGERDIVQSVQTMLKELEYEVGEIDGYMGPTTRNIMNIYQRIHGLKQTETVSAEVLDHLSRATKRGPARDWHIYVKQEFGTLFDAPIEMRDPDSPMGTHLYQALEFEPSATSTRWTTIPGDEASTAYDAKAVLDRIMIPEETRVRIANLLTPGSSLIVTDRGKSDEANEYTDFIVRLPAAKAPAKAKGTSEAATADAGDEVTRTVRKKRKRHSASAVRVNRLKRARARQSTEIYFWQ